MKTRELPRSLWRAWTLGRTPVERLGRGATPTPGRVLVSLTSIPSRLGVVHTTVRSLLDQSRRPERIVLWLNDELEGRVPAAIRELEGERFQVAYRPGTESHRKLVYALREFPECAVVVCDDDHMYPRDWLDRLFREHETNPGAIVGHECRRILQRPDGRVEPYARWVGEQPGASHAGTLAIGYGGVLYPAGALDPRVLDRDLYMELAPRADDLWFKAMAVLAGTPVRRSSSPPAKPLPIFRSQVEQLSSTNIQLDGNRSQWEALSRHFGFSVAQEPVP